MNPKLNVNIGIAFLSVLSASVSGQDRKAPNVVFILADEWRGQDLGYNGNKDVLTPNLDKLATQAVNFTNTISCCAVCCPYRGSLLTGQYPLTTGVFVNDVLLNPEAPSLGKIFKVCWKVARPWGVVTQDPQGATTPCFA